MHAAVNPPKKIKVKCDWVESSAEEMDLKSLTYRKNKSNRKGTDYELILSILFLKRAVEKQCAFHLATERSYDEKFDDMYLRIGDGEKVYYVQAKHREDESKRINHGDLTSPNDSDFSLLKYFNSYLRIKASEDTSTWKNTSFYISSTIHLDCEGLNAKGIKVIEMNDIDGIFKTEDSQLCKCYKLEILENEVQNKIFKDVYSNLRKLSRKLLEHFFEEKKINIGQVPILKSYHFALVKEIVDNSDCNALKFYEDFVEDSENLSPEAKRFRQIIYESGKELLKEMKDKLQILNPKERKKFNEILENYEEVLQNRMFDEDAVKVFWEKIKLIKLPVVGQFGQLDIKHEKKFNEFVNELVEKIRKPSQEIEVIEQKTEFGKQIFKLLGYVLTVKENHIKFNEEFLKYTHLPESFEQIRNKLKVTLGREIFEKLSQCTLNFSFDPRDDDKIFKGNVYWNLVDKSLDDKTVTEEIAQYLKKLVFVVTPKEDDLGRIIKEEMVKEFGERDGEVIYDTLQSKMVDWSKLRDEKGRGNYLTKEDNPYIETIQKHPRSIWFNVIQPVATFTGREKDLTEIHNMLESAEGNSVVIVQNVIVSGMGGIGKSELARKYAEVYKEDYDGNVIWIEADMATISESFISLANWLNINTQMQNGTVKDIRNVIRAVYKYFSKKKSLFIFDNAEEYKDIKMYLPNVGTDCKKPNVLLTSRNRDLFKNEEHGKIQKWDLGLLSEEEAVEFTKKTLVNKNNLKDSEMKELVNMLGCLPLALQHAVAYINQSEKDIGTYVKLFKFSKAEVKSLLNRDQIDSYDRTIYGTFKMAVERLQHMKENGKIAIDMLSMIAYLFPDNIPKNMFLKLALNVIDDDDDDEEIKRERAEMMLSRSIKLLEQYSLINVNIKTQTINIHRLVQHVIRLWICDVDKRNGESETGKMLGEMDILSETMELIYNLKIKQSMWNHIVSLWCHSCKYGKLIDKFYFSPIDYNRTPFHLLSRSGNHKEMQSIISYMKNTREGDMETYNKIRNAVINAKDDWRNTPLHWAVITNHLDAVKILVSNGADLYVKTTSVETPLYIACERGYADIVEYLVDDAGAVSEEARGSTPEYIATYYGNVDVIKILTKRFTPLEHAKYLLHSKLNARNGCDSNDLVEVFENLDKDLSRKVVNTELHGRRPLDIAADKGYSDVVEYLITKGAVVALEGYTPLHRASQEGHLSTVKVLVYYGADPKVTFEYGKTSLHYAAEWGRLDIVKYFIDDLEDDKCIDIDVTDDNEDTPLDKASKAGQLNVVKFLLNRGATITPIDYEEYKWGFRSYVLKKINDFVKNILKEDIVGEGKTYMDTECSIILEKHHITALDVAVALGEMDNVKKLLVNRTMSMSENCILIKLAELYDNSEVYELLCQNCEILSRNNQKYCKVNTCSNIFSKLKRFILGLLLIFTISLVVVIFQYYPGKSLLFYD